jgi:hypothetical protein
MSRKRKTHIILHEFRWPVLTDGYRWTTSKKSVGAKPHREVPILTAAASTDNLPVRWYEPRKDTPALYRTFADTVATEEGILRFANRFGTLGDPVTRGAAPYESWNAADYTYSLVTEEPFGAWLEHIYSMRSAIALWDLASARDVRGLRNVIVFGEDGVRYQPPASWLQPDFRQAAVIDELPEEPPWFHDEKIRAAAPFFLMGGGYFLDRYRRFGDHTAVEAAFTAVAMIADRFLRGSVSSSLYIDSEDGHAELLQDPDSLGSALWLQFAESITAGTRFRKCKACGEWFALPRQGTRSTREYCSDVCRVRTYRQRQEQARRKHAKGKPLKEIARELDTTASVVRKWLKAGEGK